MTITIIGCCNSNDSAVHDCCVDHDCCNHAEVLAWIVDEKEPSTCSISYFLLLVNSQLLTSNNKEVLGPWRSLEIPGKH